MLNPAIVYQPSIFGDEIVLRSIDWLENFPWKEDHTAKTHKDKYQICLQVKDFTPGEISVKTSDGFVVIEAKHEEKQDKYGFISRRFVRKYRLPEGCDLEKIESRITPEGMLIITSPRHPIIKQDTVIPVSHEKSNVKSKL